MRISSFRFHTYSELNLGLTLYTGFLLNGEYGGTQIYDPSNVPHGIGNLAFGLPSGPSAFAGAAVACGGQQLYFGSGYTGERKIEVGEKL